MFRWLAGRGATRRQVARELARITDEAWHRAVGDHSFLMGLSSAENNALRERAAWLLASKAFIGAQGLVVTDEIRLAIAIQAALPILNLDLVLYEGWTDIVIYPGGFLIPRTEIDEAGVVHETMQEASGEAWEGGPVILSWEDAGPDASHATNVVIHEFAHKLDLHAGGADGLPSLSVHPQINPRQWRRVLDTSFEDFHHALIAIEAAIPHDIDPESEAAAAWFATLPLDPYAATDRGEFFAVSTEAFFVDPLPLAKALPQWYGLLAQYYRQDPVCRLVPISSNREIGLNFRDHVFYRMSNVPSFDVVSEVDKHELSNAVDQANRELATRFDFKGSDASFELEGYEVTQVASSAFQLKQMLDILRGRLSARGIDVRCIEAADPLENLGGARQKITIRQGIEQSVSKKLIAAIKQAKIKVDMQINGDKLRISGKKRDDLQEAIALLRKTDVELPLQYQNFRD